MLQSFYLVNGEKTSSLGLYALSFADFEEIPCSNAVNGCSFRFLSEEEKRLHEPSCAFDPRQMLSALRATIDSIGSDIVPYIQAAASDFLHHIRIQTSDFSKNVVEHITVVNANIEAAENANAATSQKLHKIGVEVAELSSIIRARQASAPVLPMPLPAPVSHLPVSHMPVAPMSVAHMPVASTFAAYVPAPMSVASMPIPPRRLVRATVQNPQSDIPK